VLKNRGHHCGDIELAGYLANAAGPVPLDLNGKLHCPNDIDKSLNETNAEKIRKYRADHNNNTPNAISFMPAIASTSGRRETDRFFAASGVQSAQSNMGAFFHFRLVAFSSMLKSRVSSILAKAEALRINLI
jgi:hypothetical protein